MVPISRSIRVVRTRCFGNRFDLINLKCSKVRPPALKTKKRIVICGEMFRHVLSRDRTVEHPAHAGSVEIGGGDANNPASEDVHHHHDPIAFEQNRLTAEEIDAPEAVLGLPDNREPRRASVTWRGR